MLQVANQPHHTSCCPNPAIGDREFRFIGLFTAAHQLRQRRSRREHHQRLATQNSFSSDAGNHLSSCTFLRIIRRIMKGNGHIPIRFNRQAYAVSFILLCMRLYEIYAFQIPTNSHSRRVSCVVSLEKRDTIDSLWGPRVDDGEDELLLSDTSDDNGTDYSAPSSLTEEKKKRGVSRWASLNPTIKARIVKEGQERAIRSKSKREPKDARKRRE